MQPSPKQQTSEVLLARQPIFDQKLNVVAYELLFRDASGGMQGIEDGDQATTSLVLSTYSDIGIEKVVGNHLAFINLTTNLLKHPLPLPPENVVLAVLEDVEVTPEVIEAVKTLVGQGYQFALDDFVYDEKWKPLIELASIIKIDILALTEQELVKHVNLLKPYDLKLLAEKIETHEQYEFCKELGFSYFQGYFLSKPKLVSGAKTGSNKVVVMQMLAQLNNPDVDINDIEKILSEDARLSIKILKIINSAAYIKTRKIESLKQAIIFLGLSKLKEWASVISLQSVEIKTEELLLVTMVRAKMCELLAVQKNAHNPEQFFTVGLFSNLDAMFDRSMQDIIDELHLSDELYQALIERKGPLGTVLSDVVAYEETQWQALSGEFTKQQYFDAYFESLEWASKAVEALSA